MKNRKGPIGKNGGSSAPTIVTVFPSVKQSLHYSFPDTSVKIVDDAVCDSVCNYLEKAPPHVQESYIQTRAWMNKAAKRCLLKEICFQKKLFRLVGNENDDELKSSSSFFAQFMNNENVLAVTSEEKQINTITIEKILEYLSPKIKNTFQKILSGYSMSEIAGEEGCALKTINKRFERGCAHLRNILKAEIANPPPPMLRKSMNETEIGKEKYFFLIVYNILMLKKVFFTMSYIRSQNALR